MTPAALCLALGSMLGSSILEAYQVITGMPIGEASIIVGQDIEAAYDLITDEFIEPRELDYHSDQEVRTITKAVGVVSLIIGLDCVNEG